MILNEFDTYQDALKKVNLNEEVMPIYHGRLLTENVELYCKIQKILNCPCMEQCHKWLYDLDVENLDEAECTKINNLFKLGIDKGFIDDDTTDDDNVTSDKDLTTSTTEPKIPVTDPAPVITPSQSPTSIQTAPTSAFTVVYSATRDGQIKTGEAYSNSINTRSAKVDVISKLEKAGYQNISILAIEAGDPDMAGCDNTYCKQSDYVTPSYEDEDEEDLEEADLREPLAHAFHPAKINASTANTCGQDAVKISLNEDEAKAEVKKTFDEVNKEVKKDPTTEDVKKFLADNKKQLEQIKSKLDDKSAKSFEKIQKFLTNYADGKLEEADEVKDSSGITTLIRGLVKILLTLLKLTGNGIKLSGKLLDWAGKLIETGADRLNSKIKESEPVTEASEDKEDDSKDEDSEDEEDDSEDEDSEDEEDDSEDEDSEDEEDDSEEEKEEDTEEPDEKLKADKKAEDNKEDATDDKEEEELTAQDKSQLNSSYKRAFKAAMQKCKFFDKCFDDLTLEEKVKFFTELQQAWRDKADPSKFMSDKEVEALQKIVIKKQ